MKVALTTSTRREGSDAILPLIEEPMRKLSKEKYASFKIRTDPANANSTTYDVYVPYCDENSSLREIFHVRQELLRIRDGNDVTTADGFYQLGLAIFRGRSLTYFRDGVEAHRMTLQIAANARSVATENARLGAGNAMDAAAELAWRNSDVHCPRVPFTTASCNHGIHMVIDAACPHAALERVKRYLRRQCRKPLDMKVRTYALRLSYINATELALLPPNFNNRQCLTMNELIEIVTYGLPKSWTKKAIENNFDPLNGHTMATVITFFEAIEAADEYSPTPEKALTTSSASSSKKKAKKDGKKKSYDSSKKCPIHGPGHSADECRTLKALADKEKSSNSYSKNKTWTRKADDAKKKTSKDLAAVIKKAVRKELNVASKKRKESSDEESVNHASDDSEDEKSVNMADVDFEDLKIDELSDGEISV